MTEQAVQPNPEVAMVQRVLDSGMEGYTPDRIGLILRTVAPPGTTPDELALFLSFCQARDLNPLMKQVYLMKDKGGRVSIVTGIDGLRLLAQRSGEYEGQVGPEWKGAADEPWDDVPPEDNLYACRVGVMRTGFKRPIYATVRFSEFVKTDSWAVNWRDRPSHMIAIRAESHALRKAFPAETAGVTVHYEGGSQVEPTFTGDPDADLTYPQLGMLHKLAKTRGWSRAERLEEAAEVLGLDEVRSFSDLSRGQAHELIDAWQTELDAREGSEGSSVSVGRPAGEQPAPAPNVPADEPEPGAEASAPTPSPSAGRNVEEAPQAHDAETAGSASSRNVQGKGGTGGKGKAPRAARPADTSEAPRGEAERPGADPGKGAAQSGDGGGVGASDAPDPEAPHKFEGADENGPCGLCGWLLQAERHR